MRTTFALAFFLMFQAVGFTATLQVPSQYSTIQDAIDAAVAGDTVLVDPGTYLESIDFKGKGITVTSSQGPDVTTIYAYPQPPYPWASVVVFMNGEGADSVIDGFTLTGGSGTLYAVWGVIGGGILCVGASPTITNNIIIDNMANFGGGIECIEDASPYIANNIIASNKAPHQSGGGIDLFTDCDPLIVNNMIYDNQAQLEGGGIAVWDTCEPIIMNNTVAGNSAGTAGGIYVLGNPKIQNTIIWDNAPDQILGSLLPVVSCDVQGGWNGPGNIDADPCFVDPTTGDYHLTRLSPCINRGANGGAPSTDFDGDPRPWMGTVDMGADEFFGSHTLEADGFTLSEATGGIINLTLEVDLANAGRPYLLLGTISGTVPGTLLPGGKTLIPLNWDHFMNVLLCSLNTRIFSNFLGNLDASGQSTAQFNSLGPVPSGFVGTQMHYAYALDAPWEFVSNPLVVEIVP